MASTQPPPSPPRRREPTPRQLPLPLRVAALVALLSLPNLALCAGGDGFGGVNATALGHTKGSPTFADPSANVLLLVADQVGAWAVETQAMPGLHTHFAQRGATYTSAYAPASWCCPSRTAMMTGRHEASFRATDRWCTRVPLSNSSSSSCNASCRMDAAERRCGAPATSSADHGMGFVQQLQRKQPWRRFVHLGKWHLPFWLGLDTFVRNGERASDVVLSRRRRGRQVHRDAQCSPVWPSRTDAKRYGLHALDNTAPPLVHCGERRMRVASSFRGQPAARNAPACAGTQQPLGACDFLYYRVSAEKLARWCAGNVSQTRWIDPKPAGAGKGDNSPLRSSIDISSRTRSSDERLAEEAAGALRAFGQDAFFLSVSFEGAHPPWSVQQRYIGPRSDLTQKSLVVAVYRAMVARVDEQIGRVMTALEELGLSESTLSIFTSDHGALPKRHQTGSWMVEKVDEGTRMREGVRRVPMLLKFPGRVPEGAIVRSPCSLIDVGGTILASVLGDHVLLSHQRSLLTLAHGSNRRGLQRLRKGQLPSQSRPHASTTIGECKLVQQRTHGALCSPRLLSADRSWANRSILLLIRQAQWKLSVTVSEAQLLAHRHVRLAVSPFSGLLSVACRPSWCRDMRLLNTETASVMALGESGDEEDDEMASPSARAAKSHGHWKCCSWGGPAVSKLELAQSLLAFGVRELWAFPSFSGRRAIHASAHPERRARDRL